MSSRFSAREKRGQTCWRSQSSSQVGADIDKFGEQRDLERFAQERDAVGAAGAALEADHALDGLDVTEAPELEVLFDVDQLLAHVVGVPVRLRVVVDSLEHGGDRGM